MKPKFKVGDLVYYKNYGGVIGIIVGLNYREDCLMWRYHYLSNNEIFYILECDIQKKYNRFFYLYKESLCKLGEIIEAY